jgi:predicted HTH transcriptional regulator
MFNKRESEELEFKKSVSELKEGVISLSSMLNKNQHGILLFGVKNDGSVVGQQIGKNTTTSIANEIKYHLKPFVSPKIEIKKIENHDVISVEVVGSDTPYSAYGRYYKRCDDQDLEMTQQELENDFQNKNITYSKWEKAKTEYTVDNIDEQKLIEFINQANDANRLNYRYKDAVDALCRMNLMVDEHLNNAGYYLFANNKPMILKLATFATDSRITFIDNKLFRGNIFECIEEGIRYITSNIHFNAIISGIKRIEKPEIPIEAIREIVVNSFVHMRVTEGDYNEISISPHKVRIYNPGLIALNRDPKDFASGMIGSKVRNPLIAMTLYKNKTIEAFGTGFKRVFDLCDHEKINYDYHNDGIGFCFEFERNDTDLIKNESSKKFTKPNNEKTIDLHKEKTQHLLLEFALNNGNIINSIDEVVKALKKSRITIQRAINKLVELNKLQRIGSRKTGYWKLL